MTELYNGAEKLREALSFTSGDAGLDALLRGSFKAAFTSAPGARQEFRDLELRSDAELDLHLHGEPEAAHMSRADLLGRFLKNTTLAVKEIAKDIGGLARHSNNLWVQAPAPGSMRLLLRTREPNRIATAPQPQPVPGHPDSQSLDAMAVLRLTALMAQSQEAGLDSPLAATLQTLRAPARHAVAGVAKVVSDAHWTVTGTVEVSRREPESIRFGPEEAERLFQAAKTENTDTESVVMNGRIDGWAWSRGSVHFMPTGSKPFDASVPPNLAERVASLGAHEDNRVQAHFLVTTFYPAGSASAKGKSYALTQIEDLSVLADAQPPLLD